MKYLQPPSVCMYAGVHNVRLKSNGGLRLAQMGAEGHMQRGAEISNACGSPHRAFWSYCVNLGSFACPPTKEATETQLPRLLVLCLVHTMEERPRHENAGDD